MDGETILALDKSSQEITVKQLTIPHLHARLVFLPLGRSEKGRWLGSTVAL